MTEITGDELHAYADGLLDPERRLAVEARLALHPDEAARAQAWMEQNRLLHEAFDAALNEPVPLALLRAAQLPRRPAVRIGRAAAALLVTIGVGVLGYGLGRQGAVEPTALARLPREAALAHAVFSPEVRHPVEVRAAEAEHLMGWLSKRLGASLRAPDFQAQGFALLGGRLLTGGGGPVAQFMYEDAGGRRVTLYVRRDAEGQGETGFRRAREGGVEVFYWIDRDLGYALSGEVGRADMQRLADAAYAQLSP